jgi:hypothetical protein
MPNIKNLVSASFRMRFAGYDMGIVAEISQVVKRSRGEPRPQDVLLCPVPYLDGQG